MSSFDWQHTSDKVDLFGLQQHVTGLLVGRPVFLYQKLCHRMTLIAATINAGYPILLGDILVTSETGGQEQPIPTFLGSVNHRLPPNRKYEPALLTRKIYVVTDQLAVGLAGLNREMKLFLDDLKSRFNLLPVTEPHLLAFLEECGASAYPNIAAILLHAAPTPEGTLISCHHIGNSWRAASTKAFGDVFACGSGSEDFIQDAGQEWSVPVRSLSDGLTQAISLNYCLIGNILGQERISLATIEKHWGAGFEMIYFDGKRFRNMEDITIVLWHGRLNVATGKWDVNPLTILNYRYSSDGEVLVIDVAAHGDHKTYGVLPLYLRPENLDQSTLPTENHFDARRICFSYILELEERVTVGSETFTQVATPTFYTEKGADMPSSQLPEGTPNPFRSTRRDGSIPNLGLTKVDISPEGDVKILVQEGVHEHVIASMRQTLLSRLGPDGRLPGQAIEY